MRRTERQWGVIPCILGVLLIILATGTAGASEQQLRASLKQLDRWLGDTDRGDGWRRYLKSDQLREQLEQGDLADRAVVKQVLDQYESDAAGLHLRRFVAVRRAVQAWLEQLPALRAQDLPQAARDAIAHFRSISSEEVDVRRKRLRTALAELDEHMLASGISSAYKRKSFLQWDELEAELAAESGPTRKVLRKVEANFYQNKKGLEHEKFLAARQALRAFTDALTFSSSDQSSKYVEQNLNLLTTQLETFQAAPNTDDAEAIGRILGWLERYGQAEEVVRMVRQYHSRPNLFLMFSEDMLKTGVEMDIDEGLRIRELILGTSIYGNARMKGKVTLDLIPSADRAAIDIVLGGTTYSNNVGYNGPVKIYSNSNTSINARQRLFLTSDGLSCNRARASCRTRTNITSIKASRRLVQNIAWNKARQAKPKAESIASSRAGQKVRARIEEQVGVMMNRGNQVFEDRLQKPLIRRDGWPSVFKFNTTEDSLHLTMQESPADRLAAPDQPPALLPGSDFAVELHESFIGNMCQVMMAGVTLTDQRMEELATDLLGRNPEELGIMGNDSWSITFADSRPVNARFEGDLARIVIRGKKFSRGSQSISEPAEISATYRLEKGPGGIRMTRQGDVQVKFIGSENLGGRQTAMKVFLQKKFENLFKPEIVSEGLALPGGWAKQDPMRLSQLQCDGGWLVLAWRATLREARTARRN